MSDDRDDGPNVHCIIIESPAVLYTLAVLHIVACLVTVGLALLAICKYYSKADSPVLKKLRIGCIFGSIAFVLADVDSLVDWFFALACDRSDDSYLSRFDSIGVIFVVAGYNILYWIFVIKLQTAFQDTVFAVSPWNIRVLVVLGLTQMIGMSSAALWFVLEFWVVGLIFLSVGSTIYIIANIYMLRVLVSKLLSYMNLNKEVMTLNLSNPDLPPSMRQVSVPSSRMRSSSSAISVSPTAPRTPSENGLIGENVELPDLPSRVKVRVHVSKQKSQQESQQENQQENQQTRQQVRQTSTTFNASPSIRSMKAQAKAHVPAVNRELLQALVRLTVVYLVAILSNLIVTFGTGVTSSLLVSDVEEYNTWNMWFRLLFNLDHSLNVACLLFQHEVAGDLYVKCCRPCHVCVVKLCACLCIRNKRTDVQVDRMPSTKSDRSLQN